MTIKLMLLKSGEDIIADITEMGSSGGNDRRVIGYFLNKPCVVKMRDPSLLSEEPEAEGQQKAGYSVSLFPWMPLTKDETVPIAADWVITMVEPIDRLKEMYIEDIVQYGRQGNQSSSTSKQSKSNK